MGTYGGVSTVVSYPTGAAEYVAKDAAGAARTISGAGSEDWYGPGDVIKVLIDAHHYAMVLKVEEHEQTTYYCSHFQKGGDCTDLTEATSLKALKTKLGSSASSGPNAAIQIKLDSLAIVGGVQDRNITLTEFRGVASELEDQGYGTNDYDLLANNCEMYCDAFGRKLRARNNRGLIDRMHQSHETCHLAYHAIREKLADHAQ